MNHFLSILLFEILLLQLHQQFFSEYVDAVNIEMKCPPNGSFIPHPFDCTKYIGCNSDSTNIVYTCNPPFYFNPKTSSKQI